MDAYGETGSENCIACSGLLASLPHGLGAGARLQPGPDGLQQPEAHRAVVACERDHEAHSPVLGCLGKAGQGADAGKGAGLEASAFATAEQVGMGLEEVQQLGKAARRKAVAATDARPFSERDARAEAVLGEHLFCAGERLREGGGPAKAPPAD